MKEEHPEIPKGPYCYHVEIDPETGKSVTKSCKYWKAKLVKGHPGAFCSFLNETSEYAEFASLLWDKVKECGINNDWEE